LKVCFVSSVFPRSDEDLEVPWLRILARELRAEGHAVTVFAPSFRGLRSHLVDGTPVTRFRYFFAPWETLTHEEGAPNKIHRFHYKVIALFYVLFGTIGLVRLHLRERFDVLHVHWPFPHGVFALAARLFAPSRIVLTYYGADLLLARKFPFVRLFLRHFTKRADAVIAISGFTATEVRRIHDRDIAIIPYGTAVAQPARPPSHSPGHRILSVGRLIWRKGFSFLVEAMPLVLERFPDAHLTIAGGGNLREELCSLRDRLGLSSCVDIPGKVSTEVLEDLYARCDVFVLPSIVDHKGDTEGLGVVIIEAFVNGKPVVATDVGGIGDIVLHERTGLLVEQKSASALADAICRTLGDPEEARRFAAQGLVRVQECFSWPMVVSRVAGVYHEVTTRR